MYVHFHDDAMHVHLIVCTWVSVLGYVCGVQEETEKWEWVSPPPSSRKMGTPRSASGKKRTSKTAHKRLLKGIPQRRTGTPTRSAPLARIPCVSLGHWSWHCFLSILNPHRAQEVAQMYTAAPTHPTGLLPRFFSHGCGLGQWSGVVSFPYSIHTVLKRSLKGTPQPPYTQQACCLGSYPISGACVTVVLAPLSEHSSVLRRSVTD